MRIATYNVHQGKGTDGLLSWERIARTVEALNADVVGLQEVFHPFRFSGKEERPLENLARLLKGDWAFGKNEDFRDRDPGGDYGNALVARGEIASVRNHRLPRSHSETAPPEEQRGLLEVRVRGNGTALALFVTHLDSARGDDRLRVLQVEKILEILRPCGGPHLLIGDFNTGASTRPIGLVREAGYRDAFVTAGEGEGGTIPDDDLSARIDYLFVPEDLSSGIKRCRVAGGARGASDHLPVVLDLDWP